MDKQEVIADIASQLDEVLVETYYHYVQGGDGIVAIEDWEGIVAAAVKMFMEGKS